MEIGIRQIYGTRRQVMDWSLVLASQEIETTIAREENRWSLAVAETDFEKASAAIKQYRLENRGWLWRPKAGGSGLAFHWGSGLWVLAIVALYFWSEVRFPAAKPAGLMNNQAVAAGEWWRLFTAVTLHADAAHLAANLSAGFFLFGLAMARYGAGTALLAGFVAGALGNLLGFFCYDPSHQGLGASGMVMGALGLLTVQSFPQWKKYPRAMQIMLRTFVGGLFLLILWGTSPQSDILAHLGGFLGGCLLGGALNFVPEKILQQPLTSRMSAVVLLMFAGWTWWLAVR